MNSPALSRKWLLAAPFLVFSLSSCGGGGASPDPDISGPAQIENSLSRADFRDSDEDRYYDIYICDVRQSGVAGIEMRSLDFDAAVLVYVKDSGGDFDLIGENDDISDQNSDARLEFDVSRGKSYRILATSANANARGEYSLFFSANLGRPARVLPEANRTAPGLKLPALGNKK